MEYKDICTKKTYEQNGEQKIIWLKCGTLRTNDEGKQFIELNHLPNTPFFVFEKKKKEGQREAF